MTGDCGEQKIQQYSSRVLSLETIVSVGSGNIMVTSNGVGILYSDSAHHLAVQAGGGRRENHLICIFILHWTFKGFRDLV